MKFLLLKWHVDFNSYPELDLSPFGEIVFKAREIAAKYDLEVVSINFIADTLKVYFYGNKTSVKKFFSEFRIGLIEHLNIIYKQDITKLISNFYIIREIREDNLSFLKCIRKEVSVRNIGKHLFSYALDDLLKVG